MLCAQLCLTLRDFIDFSPPGPSVPEILPARIQEGLPFPPPGVRPHPGIELESLVPPALTGGFFTTSA